MGEYEGEENEINEGLNKYEQIKEKLAQKKKEKKEAKSFEKTTIDDGFNTISGNEARCVNEKIAKNKGLTKRRKKIDGNSRVKLRLKYKKAQIKHRSKGHVVRENPGRHYEGEAPIKYGLVKSVKIQR